MTNNLDLIGKKFGRLTVIEKVAGKTKKYSYWKCLCDCGDEKVVEKSSLTSGNTKSCGCYRKEVTARLKYRHGLRNTSLFERWHSMINRCKNPGCSGYKNYGGRGIFVCEEWKRFENFYEWSMNNGYSHELQIDRINNDGNYEPSNCRWVTRSENCKNRRTSKRRKTI